MNEELDKDKGMEIDYINAEENKETVIQATVDLYQFVSFILRFYSGPVELFLASIFYILINFSILSSRFC